MSKNLHVACYAFIFYLHSWTSVHAKFAFVKWTDATCQVFIENLTQSLKPHPLSIYQKLNLWWNSFQIWTSVTLIYLVHLSSKHCSADTLKFASVVIPLANQINVSAFEFFAIGDENKTFILYTVKGGGMPRQPWISISFLAILHRHITQKDRSLIFIFMKLQSLPVIITRYSEATDKRLVNNHLSLNR